jgi:phosphoenolpyruvate carboxykinase (ATP)
MVHPVFRFAIPETCPGVPDHILNPEKTWKDPGEYQEKALELAHQFIDNFKKYEHQVPEEILRGAPGI